MGRFRDTKKDPPSQTLKSMAESRSRVITLSHLYLTLTLSPSPSHNMRALSLLPCPGDPHSASIARDGFGNDKKPSSKESKPMGILAPAYHCLGLTLRNSELCFIGGKMLIESKMKPKVYKNSPIQNS